MVQKRAKNVTVPVHVAIDASGSMYKAANDVRGGFNQYIADLSRDTMHTYRVSLYLFNTTVEKLQDTVEPTDVVTLSDENYRPMGGTALFDAIGEIITGYEAAEGERPLVVVHTDGEENSSSEWNLKPLKALVAARIKEGWGFVYLGQGIDTWQGEALGMYSGMTVNTSAGTRGTYEGLSMGTVAYASGASAKSVTETAGQWSRRADEDDKRGE